MTTKRSLSFALMACGMAALPGGLHAQETAIKGEEPPPPVPSAESMADWPCVQRKVDYLTVAQVWDGPAVEGKLNWQNDKDIFTLVTTLASRRIPVEQAEAAIKKFADAQPADVRDKRLGLLFAALFEKVNNERKSVVTGIERYQRSQKDRSAELERQSTAIAEIERKGATDEKSAADLAKRQEDFQWAQRIFQERQTSIPIACELPILIEERLSSMIRAIRSQMKS
jgi:hypothetical protein